MKTKVLLTGTFGAGKTTLTQLLASVPGIAVVEEYARELLATQPDLQRVPEFQQLLLEEHLRREAAAEQEPVSLIICDRGVPDIICYSRFYGHACDIQSLLRKARYDKVFLVSPHDVDCTGRFSPEQQRVRLVLHQCFEATFREIGLCYTHLSGSPELRIARISEELREWPSLEPVVNAIHIMTVKRAARRHLLGPVP